ncbi:MAG: hypothetical protein COU32_03580 [Candidatus Magasanikbacteria bacterium CG10_big_fil_rev_8_21_14_0_10_42_10]|uniref:Band 7 domain-containing protein n=2 Tax=Candidatus Magasanikiibacteriota TaxID=1752731 RepID=A0A2H0TVH1_9BACT|nr:MAG: hypothetical protein COU32_03580 [Candidatus Magasanikbacteria bacterium CG10_big_fil_rev_8_21_14_0_10_42_10]PIZ94582.1 MAG: hypothetical protein COX82_00425 [Candidatus Magasanikbacteria bacterium CG_4_10_14_0_2_um_filter_41_10]
MIYILLSILVVIGVSIRRVTQHHQAIIYTLGNYTRLGQPGWHIVIPVVQSIILINTTHPEAQKLIAQIQAKGDVDEELYKKVVIA